MRIHDCPMGLQFMEVVWDGEVWCYQRISGKVDAGRLLIVHCPMCGIEMEEVDDAGL